MEHLSTSITTGLDETPLLISTHVRFGECITEARESDIDLELGCFCVQLEKGGETKLHTWKESF